MQRRGLCASLAVSISLACFSTAAQATNVVNVTGGPAFDLTIINDFYNSLPNTTSTILTGTLDTHNLTGVNLLWEVQPINTYTAAELTTMSNFLAGGGRIAFMGEHGQFQPVENSHITAAVAALGGHMAINVDAPDSGSRLAVRVPTDVQGQILTNPLTTGVNSYYYACFASLNLSGPAVPLMLGSVTDSGSSVMMAYETVGPGSLFLITDQNVWDSSGAAQDNHRMFENVLAGEVQGAPEPTSLALLGLGAAGILIRRRRA